MRINWCYRVFSNHYLYNSKQEQEMKILNLYAGIGGNRKLWGDTHDITAVEFRDDIAAIYKDFFPNDNGIVGDAHEYLLRQYIGRFYVWIAPANDR